MQSVIPTTIDSGCAIRSFLWISGSAVSDEAAAIQQTKRDIASYTEQSYALFGNKDGVISSICELEVECADPDWDGYGAEGVSMRAAITARDFIKVLPEGVLMPEVSVEPDGSISLDWIKSPHCLFSVSIGSTERLAYAWMDGTDRGHGVARFDFECIPPKILQGIYSVA
jgi:hypothetical protein